MKGHIVAMGVFKMSVQPGDVFYCSWGYDQTNYDYVVVNSVSPTGKTVLCQRAAWDNIPDHDGSHFTQVEQRPRAEGFGDEFRLQVRQHYSGEGVTLVGSYPFCGDGTGSRRRGYFSQWDGERSFFETDPVFGH